MNKIRRFIQILCTVLGNGYILGFTKGNIYTGNTKSVCVPFLNCYSCPGALGSCPIGSLQAVLGDRNYKFSFYVLGTLMLFGMLFGRLVCGFLCPFGFFQDLLYKIKIPKISLPPSIDGRLRYLKYIVLISLVIVFPLLLTDSFGIGAPYFCKYLCPAGMLEGGIPLVLLNKPLQNTIGFLFFWKGMILLLVICISMVLYRPFCKYLCPLGAFYGLFNKISFFQLQLDSDKCTGCGLCEAKCNMQVSIRANCNSAECIRCGECQSVCNADAIQLRFLLKK